MYTFPLSRSFIEKEETGSTNRDIKEIIKNSASPVFTVLSAKKQSSGKGRIGRSFFSPSGGLYFSVSYPLTGNEKNIPFLTLLAGLAVHRSLKKICGCETEIKWPNDIYLNGKKLCGILCELVSEKNTLCAVVGIGINISLSEKEVPEDLKNILTSLLIEGFTANREMLLKTVTEELDKMVYSQNLLCEINEDIIKEIRRLSYLTNKKVKYMINGEETSGIMTDINCDGSALIKTDNGEIISVFSGEITA